MKGQRINWKNEYNQLRKKYSIVLRGYNEQKERIELLEKENKSLSNSLEHLLGIEEEE
ncbi:hypothetical protein [Enterococcus larvae]|uniref:hypothetical protein n=1 Tax=Enterococcus larvae TaxID=2794352 RepID=UPI003F2B9AA9